MSVIDDLVRDIRTEWDEAVQSIDFPRDDVVAVGALAAEAVGIAEWLIMTRDFRIGGMTVRDEGPEWSVHYHFYSGQARLPWVVLTVATSPGDPRMPSLSARIHAADWLEREAEDHFGLQLEGHPRLGDFVLHDELWQEGLAPMRKGFDAGNREIERHPNLDWRPRRLLHTQGAFSMTVGPIHGGVAEPVHFLIESIGEEVIRLYPRLFYKYRAIEKLAEGRSPDSALLLAERFDAMHAFAHSLALCRAFERSYNIEVPLRAKNLRVALAELERLRSHIGAIRGICASTGLGVAESQAAILEEEALRLCGKLSGHRYLFGLNAIGGLALDLADSAVPVVFRSLGEFKAALITLREMLANSSSFLDRLEEVGTVPSRKAAEYGLVGPIARASNHIGDLRLSNPYEGYEVYEFQQAAESEGDGYARLRVLFFEALQSIEICRQAFDGLKNGPVQSADRPEAGHGERRSGFGWVEAPGGAAFHAVWVDEGGRIERYRIVPPSFFNWHGFHLAAEGSAFQDLPIILATFALSVAENDR